MTIRRWSLACLPLLLLLTACTTQDQGLPVAHLPSTSATAPTGGSAPDPSSAQHAARPQLRIDDSDARVAALVNRWRQCLLDHGAKRASGDDIAPTASDHVIGILLHDPVPAAATAACIGLEPLEPKELAAATNPRFHEQSQQWIACMREQGLWLALVNDETLTATYVPGHAQPDDLGIEERCLTSVFGGDD